jgi:hypothetical protein
MGLRRFELVAALQYRTHDPQVVHVLAAHGAEAGDDTASGTLTLGKPSARPRTHDGLSHLGSGIVVTLRDVAHQAAFADGLINGSASPPAKAAQRETVGTTCIGDWPPAWAAGSTGHSAFVSERSVGTHGSAVEPRLVIELAGLHVKPNRNKTRITECIRGRSSAGTAAEVPRRALVRQNENRSVEAAVAATIVIAIPIAVLILRVSQRSQSDHNQNREDRRDSRRRAVPLAGSYVPVVIPDCHMHAP